MIQSSTNVVATKNKDLSRSALSLAIVGVFLLSAKVEAESTTEPNVTISIFSVTRRTDPPVGAATGVLDLRFISRFTKPCHIMGGCWDMHTIGPYSKAGLTDGDFATLQYEWFDKSGMLKVRGTYDLSEDILLQPATQQSTMVPIMLPPPGPYRLRVTFDNARIKKISETHGYRQPGFFIFFKATDEAAVVAPRAMSAN